MSPPRVTSWARGENRGGVREMSFANVDGALVILEVNFQGVRVFLMLASG